MKAQGDDVAALRQLRKQLIGQRTGGTALRREQFDHGRPHFRSLRWRDGRDKTREQTGDQAN